MPIATTDVLDILSKHDIDPLEDIFNHFDLPAIGGMKEDEDVYTTSLGEVLGRREADDTSVSERQLIDNPRMREWQDKLEHIIDNDHEFAVEHFDLRAHSPQESICAWYCPIHFFGHEWGIYIRENCILTVALDIARFVNWQSIQLSQSAIECELLRSAFYVLFLHEQFHHKVESLGLRLLISTGSDRYRPYKSNVYRSNYNTPDCIEESLANAESYRRLSERRYTQRVYPAIRKGLRNYLKWTIPLQPPGYREGIRFISETTYRDGLFDLQSQILDGKNPPITPRENWSIAPNMITSLADINDDIYVVLPKGSHPILPFTNINPGTTVSSRVLISSLTRHYGYQTVEGGKGSHVKLKKPGFPTITLAGDRSTLSPGIVKNVLKVFGGLPISRLPDLVDGKLPLPF